MTLKNGNPAHARARRSSRSPFARMWHWGSRARNVEDLYMSYTYMRPPPRPVKTDITGVAREQCPNNRVRAEKMHEKFFLSPWSNATRNFSYTYSRNGEGQTMISRGWLILLWEFLIVFTCDAKGKKKIIYLLCKILFSFLTNELVFCCWKRK